MKNWQKVLESNGFDVEYETDNICISQYTPAGEDWSFSVTSKEDFIDYAENFDPEEEFEMWVEAKRNGVSGVPGPAELWQDQLWKQKILQKCAKKVK